MSMRITKGRCLMDPRVNTLAVRKSGRWFCGICWRGLADCAERATGGKCRERTRSKWDVARRGKLKKGRRKWKRNPAGALPRPKRRR